MTITNRNRYPIYGTHTEKLDWLILDEVAAFGPIGPEWIWGYVEEQIDSTKKEVLIRLAALLEAKQLVMYDDTEAFDLPYGGAL